MTAHRSLSTTSRWRVLGVQFILLAPPIGRGCRFATRSKRALLVAACLIWVGACGFRQLDTPGEGTAVGTGATTFRYPEITPEDRIGRRIELVRDLEIRGVDGDPNYEFYRPSGIAVDKDGNIYVADSGNHRIQIFDNNGVYLDTLGGEGFGPGEFRLPMRVVVAGDQVIVGEARSGRVSVLGLDGSWQKNLAHPTRGAFAILATVADGTLLTRETVRKEDGSLRQIISVVSDDLEEIARVGEFDPQLGDYVAAQGRSISLGGVLGMGPSYVASAGRVYVTRGDDYQVIAFDGTGNQVWSIRRENEPGRWSKAMRKKALSVVQQRFPEIKAKDLPWPDHAPAISSLAVDGAGNLYVYPYVEELEHTTERPVDVYSRDGTILFAGYVASYSWSVSRGEHVYAVGLDTVTGEYHAVRWKLIRPFRELGSR